MSLFLIMGLQANGPSVDAAITSKVPQENAYEVESGKWLVNVEQATAKAVSDSLGLTETASHIVVPVRTYFGRAQPDLWEWMAAKVAKSNA